MDTRVKDGSALVEAGSRGKEEHLGEEVHDVDGGFREQKRNHGRGLHLQAGSLGGEGCLEVEGRFQQRAGSLGGA